MRKNMSANLYFFLFCFILAAAEAINIAKPGCRDKCGNVSIPHPFGIGRSCSFDRSTELKCDTTFNPPKLLFVHSILHQVVELSVPTDGYLPTVRIKHNISRICSDESGAITSSYDSFLALNNTSFRLTDNNQFTVIGCYMYGLITSNIQEEDYSGTLMRGCATVCDRIENTVEGQCDAGSGCCQMEIVRGSYVIHLQGLNVSGITRSRCGSAFVSESYNFNASDIDSIKETTIELNAQFGNQSCEKASKDPSSFACKGNTECIDQRPGYICICKDGYEGNPYLDSGCPNPIGGNECSEVQKKTCKYKCIKNPGVFPYFYCAGKPRPPYKWIILGVGLGLLFLLGCGVAMYYIKSKQLSKLTERLTELNARLLLLQEISSNAKIFTAMKLQQATNNFHESRILGQGGYGTVYKGILPDQSIVAVKKSKNIEKSQFDEFINEVAILSKIDHRNIVKLLGCCVETENPLLVYEFVSNGTLSDHIFKKSGKPYSSMSWENRLRIAAEIAGALAYLHSAASIPIIHRDVKSSNILLDDNLTAKVADFGVSRLNHMDQTAISTLVKGTLGYLDPEYMLTSQLTEKSDVFSFGVVLAEILTGMKSISFERAEGEQNLAIYFTASMNGERLLDIVEEGVVNEGNIKQVQATAALAIRCFNFKGEERPSMREVASELEALRGFIKKHSSSQKSNYKDTNYNPNQTDIHFTSEFNNGPSQSSVAEITMSVMVAR